MRGDEAGLGTPNEDMASLAAVAGLPSVTQKILISVGFGADAYHGVCHAQILEAVAELTRSGGFLGCFSMLRQQPSVINSSILSALEGKFGDAHRTHKTFGSELWINPLMTTMWAFDLAAVARRILFLADLKKTHTLQEIDELIQTYRRRHPHRDWDEIPI